MLLFEDVEVQHAASAENSVDRSKFLLLSQDSAMIFALHMQCHLLRQPRNDDWAFTANERSLSLLVLMSYSCSSGFAYSGCLMPSQSRRVDNNAAICTDDLSLVMLRCHCLLRSAKLLLSLAACLLSYFIERIADFLMHIKSTCTQKAVRPFFLMSSADYL